MARGIWTGAISFGLINIPVVVLTAKQEERLSFRMLDKKDHAPIGYKQINKSTGREVDRKNIVKAYEYQKNQFVVVTDQDFKKANPKATQTIDIDDFIDVEDLDPLLFDKPYYLIPGKNGEKGYVLLRDVLEKTKKVAIGQFVIRNKQHLVAMMARGEYIILETLRYPHEIREVKEAKFLDDVDLSKVRISAKEMKMAEELVEGMTTPWKPGKYKDTYQSDLLKAIQHKIKTGKTETPPDVDEAPTATDTNIEDLMPLLERSLRSSSKGGETRKTRKRTGVCPSRSARSGRSKSERARHKSELH